jgi:hypothetical protein
MRKFLVLFLLLAGVGCTQTEKNLGANVRVFTISQGGTGTSTLPTVGQLLVGTASGTYNLTTTVPDLTLENVTTTNLYASGTASFANRIGINSSTPQAQLGIEATSGVDPLLIASSSPIFNIKPDGAVVINSRNSSYLFSSITVRPQLMLTNPNGNALYALLSYSNNPLNFSTQNFLRFGGTEDNPSAVTSSSRIGGFTFYGAKSATSVLATAQIRGEIDGTPNEVGSDMPGRLIFSTAADNTATLQERLRITASGTVGINSSSPMTQFAVKGSASINPLEITSSTNESLFKVLTNGKTGISSSSPFAKLSVTGAEDGSDTLAITDAFNTKIFTVNGSSTVNLCTPDSCFDYAPVQLTTFGQVNSMQVPIIKIVDGLIQFTSSTGGQLGFYSSEAVVMTDTTATSTYGINNFVIGQSTNDPTGKLSYSNSQLNVKGAVSVSAASGAPYGYININTNGTTGTAMNASGTLYVANLGSSATGNAVCITASNQITDAGGGTCTPSALRTKEDIRPFEESAIEKIMRMNVVLAKYKENIRTLDPNEDADIITLIADDLAKIDNRLVDYDKEGNVNSINIMQMDALYAKAFQEQQAQIMELRESIIRLESRVGIIERIFNLLKEIFK